MEMIGGRENRANRSRSLHTLQCVHIFVALFCRGFVKYTILRTSRLSCLFLEQPFELIILVLLKV